MLHTSSQHATDASFYPLQPTTQHPKTVFFHFVCGCVGSYNIGTTISFNFDRETVHAAMRNFQCQGIPVIMITLVPQMSFASG
jgi:hypothetical protein